MRQRRRHNAEKKDKTSLKHSIGSIRSVSMGSTDDMEQGGTSSNFKKQLNSYVFRRRLSFAGIGIALIGVGATVTFVVMHMNGKFLTIELACSILVAGQIIARKKSNLKPKQ